MVQQQPRARRADAGAAQPDSPVEIVGTEIVGTEIVGTEIVGTEIVSTEIVSTWRALAARHAAVVAALERELGERHGLGVTEFEVLERLAENDEHKFRVQELAESVHLSQSALSRMIGRLEQHGLVQRSMCDVDRRGIDVCLTEDGRRRHAEALPTQRSVLAATLAR